jgi:diacylglycerol kinase (ATP)
MRVLAVFGPNVDSSDLVPFESAAQVAIPVVNSIDRASPPDVILIFGGDGTIHRHLPMLVATQVPALIVPTGSGNDFARALGLTNLARALAAWHKFCETRKNVRCIDVGEITAIDHRPSTIDPPPAIDRGPSAVDAPPAIGHRPSAIDASSAVDHRPSTVDLFCCVAGAGIDSEVNRRANRLPRWLRAHGGYALSLLPAAANFRPRPFTVHYEDATGATGEISEPALMCAFANAQAYGHGMRVAPAAQLDDGLLDLIFVRRASAARLLTLFPTIYFGSHLRLPEVEYRRVRRLHIKSDPASDIYADGEFICRTPAEVTVRARVLRVITNHV